MVAKCDHREYIPWKLIDMWVKGAASMKGRLTTPDFDTGRIHDQAAYVQISEEMLKYAMAFLVISTKAQKRRAEKSIFCEIRNNNYLCNK